MIYNKTPFHQPVRLTAAHLSKDNLAGPPPASRLRPQLSVVLPATPPWRLEREEDVSATEADGCVKASASHLQAAAWTPPLQPTVAPETGRAITPRRGEAEAPLHPQQQKEGIIRKMELQQKKQAQGKAVVIRWAVFCVRTADERGHCENGI